MAFDRELICLSTAVKEGGAGARFKLSIGCTPRPAFLVRFEDKPHAFLNSCPHMGVELDWQQGEFFDQSGLYLICSTHGAVFMPDNGYCTGGPCKGRRLTRLPVVEHDGSIFLAEGFHLYVK